MNSLFLRVEIMSGCAKERCLFVLLSGFSLQLDVGDRKRAVVGDLELTSSERNTPIDNMARVCNSFAHTKLHISLWRDKEDCHTDDLWRLELGLDDGMASVLLSSML